MARVKDSGTPEAQRTFGPFPPTGNPAILQVDAGTGTVTVQALHGMDPDTWVDIVAYDQDVVERIDVAGLTRIRIEVTGDATFVFLTP